MVFKEKIERSEAILGKKRNTRKGLQKRNKILKYLYDHSIKSIFINELIKNTGLSYSTISYHLKNMLKENVVSKKTTPRKVSWQITGLGQQTIKKWLEENSK